MSNQPFNNDTDQQTRRQVLKDTYLSRAQADADMIGGRFKQQTQTHVTGAPSYPRQPSNSPWSQSLDELTGPEPPFPIDIDFVDALGGESPAPVVSALTVETTSATSDGGALAPKGRDGLPSSPVSARSFRRNW